MKIITEEYIKNYSFSELANQYAKSILKNQGIDEIQINQINDQYCIESSIHIIGNDVKCRFNIDFNMQITKQECTCNSENCGYLLAVILYLSNLEITQFPYHYTNPKREQRMLAIQEKKQMRWNKQKDKLISKGRQFLSNEKQKYEQSLLMNQINQDIEILPIINYDYDELFLSYKVGQKQKYVIKNIREFVTRINQKEKFTYGKNLTFIHQIECFDELAQKHINFMKSHLGVFNRKNYYEVVNEKQFELKGNLLDDYFEEFNNIDEQIDLESIDASINIKVTEVEDLYCIEYDDQMYIEGANHLYEYNEMGDILIQHRCDCKGKTVAFIHELLQEAIYIPKNEYPQFYKYVLSEIMPYLEIKGMSLLENEVETCSLIKCYGDINDEGEVYFTLEYHNESGTFTKGFDDQNIIGYNQELVEAYIQKYASYIDKTDHIAYFNNDDEDTFEFISNGLPFLSQYCEIFVSDMLRNLGRKHDYTIQVGVKFESDLLAIDIESAEIPKGELGDVLSAYRRRKKFYRLKNGKLLVLESNQLDELDNLLDAYHLSGKDMNKGKVEIPSYRLFSLEEKINDAQFIQMKRSKTLKNKSISLKK